MATVSKNFTFDGKVWREAKPSEPGTLFKSTTDPQYAYELFGIDPEVLKEAFAEPSAAKSKPEAIAEKPKKGKK